MKKFYIFLCLAIASLTQLQAQAPQGFNYQATVRNSSGDLIVNTNVYFKFNVIQGSETSVPIFTETHYVPTDDLGQVNLVIGQGTPSAGTFSELDWSQGSYYLGIELDTGNGYLAMGTTQLLSVPYALYAENSGNSTPTTPNLEAVLAENNSANNQQIKDLQDPTDAQDAVTKAYLENNTTSSGLAPGSTVGDMLYWDGENWTQIPSPENNAILKFCDGQLTWGDCRPHIVIHENTNYYGSSASSVYYDLYPNGSTVSDIRLFLSQTNNLPDENDLVSYGWPLNYPSSNYNYQLTGEISICDIPIGTYYVRAKVESNLGTSYSETIQVVIDQNNSCYPDPVVEEEVITTMTITLQPSDGGADVVLETRDIDGGGPDIPVVTVSGNLFANTEYSGSIVLLNETVDPAENMTEEIEEESLEQQFFYTIGSGLNAITEYMDEDPEGNPIGLDFTLTTTAASSGAITFTLRHEPVKSAEGVADGDITNAGGETDIEATFTVTIE